MSRIGRQAVPLPKGVEVSFRDGVLSVKGPKVRLERRLPDSVDLERGDGWARFATRDPARRAAHGLAGALLRNMVRGVSQGFERRLEINGVGYRADVQGQVLNLSLGYSHPIAFPLPEGVSAKVEKNVVTLSGADKEAVGRTAAKVRALRPPEPYKGKGIKYVEEHIRRKVGKTGASG